LIEDVNPLKKVKALVPSGENQVEEKYLDFSFALIKQDDDEQMLLVTVNDVTDSILLEQEAIKKESDAEHQMLMFSQLSKVSPADLKVLINELESGYESINNLLKNNKNVQDNYESLDAIKFFSNKLQSYGLEPSVALLPSKASQPSENPKWWALNKLATKLGEQKGVPVDVHLRGFKETIDKHLNDALYPMAVQLIRNSIAHGFESNETRGQLKKPNAGQISISFSHDNNGNYRFVYEDDGRGFDYESIRQALIKEKNMSHKETNKLTKTDLIKRAFSDRITTQNRADELSGRGVGLALVWSQIKTLKGNLKVRSIEKEFTQFVIDFTDLPNTKVVKLAS